MKKFTSESNIGFEILFPVNSLLIATFDDLPLLVFFGAFGAFGVCGASLYKQFMNVNYLKSLQNLINKLITKELQINFIDIEIDFATQNWFTFCPCVHLSDVKCSNSYTYMD